MLRKKTPPWKGLSAGPMIVACHVNRSSPTGPALQLDGGSLDRSCSSLVMRLSATAAGARGGERISDAVVQARPLGGGRPRAVASERRPHCNGPTPLGALVGRHATGAAHECRKAAARRCTAGRPVTVAHDAPGGTGLSEPPRVTAPAADCVPRASARAARASSCGVQTRDHRRLDNRAFSAPRRGRKHGAATANARTQHSPLNSKASARSRGLPAAAARTRRTHQRRVSPPRPALAAPRGFVGSDSVLTFTKKTGLESDRSTPSPRECKGFGDEGCGVGVGVGVGADISESLLSLRH